MASTQLRHIARFISIIGHPLLTISILVLYLSHKEMPKKEADLVSAIIVGGITIPIILHNLWKTQKGQYTNFDVSNRKQRKGFFLFSIVLLALVSLWCWRMGLSSKLVYSMWIFLSMVILFAIVNYKSKISMHAGVNFYIVAIMLHYNMILGLACLALAILVAASRLVLKRHTLLEVIVGACVGFVFGWANAQFL